MQTFCDIEKEKLKEKIKNSFSEHDFEMFLNQEPPVCGKPFYDFMKENFIAGFDNWRIEYVVRKLYKV